MNERNRYQMQWELVKYKIIKATSSIQKQGSESPVRKEHERNTLTYFYMYCSMQHGNIG